MTLPLENNTASENTKKLAELLELESGERLCEGVRYHVIHRAIDQIDVTLSDGLANKVKVDVDVFGAAVECGVLGEADSTLVVTK